MPFGTTVAWIETVSPPDAESSRGYWK